MRKPGQFSEKVLPPRPVTSIARQAVADLRASIQRIEGWMGKAFSQDSRPYAALRVLEDVAETARFTYEQRGDHDALRALQLVLDLREIAPSLPAQLVKDIRVSLETCARGPLDPGEDRQPVQEQSALGFV